MEAAGLEFNSEPHGLWVVARTAWYLQGRGGLWCRGGLRCRGPAVPGPCGAGALWCRGPVRYLLTGPQIPGCAPVISLKLTNCFQRGSAPFLLYFSIRSNDQVLITDFVVEPVWFLPLETENEPKRAPVDAWPTPGFYFEDVPADRPGRS